MSGACPMSPLVHARSDGRLGSREAASLERHLRVCGECAALGRDLGRVAELGRRVGDLPARAPLEQRRARLRLLRAAATPGEPSSRSRRRRALALGLAGSALAVVLSLAAVGRLWSSTPPRLRSLAVPTMARADGDGLAAQVQPGPDSQHAVHKLAGLELVRLEGGTIDLRVAPLSVGQRVVVVTADAELEVRGTDFRVSAASGRLRAVEVREGRVELRHPSGTVLLGAGERWPAPESRAEAQPVQASRPEAIEDAPAGPSRGSETRSAAGEPRESAEAAPRPVRAEPTDHRAAASAAFARAVHALERGECDRAITLLRAFLAAHPDDPRAEDARWLVVVAHQRAGRTRAAQSAAQDYLERHPRGYRQPEAQSLAADER